VQYLPTLGDGAVAAVGLPLPLAPRHCHLATGVPSAAGPLRPGQGERPIGRARAPALTLDLFHVGFRLGFIT